MRAPPWVSTGWGAQGFRWRPCTSRSNLPSVQTPRQVIPLLLGLRTPLGLRAAAAFLWVASACSPSTDAPRVASVTTDVSTLTLYIGTGGGQSRQLTATPRDGDGTPIEGRAVTWASLSPSIASVSPSGLVTALALGAANITATSGGATATVSVTVARVPVASVSIGPDSIDLQRSPIAAGTYPLGVQMQDSAGGAIFGRPTSWTSSATGVATVASDGVVSAVGSGVSIVRATVEGLSDSVVVTVTATNDLPPGFDLAIDNVRWTQAAQNEMGSIPMLLGGRDAVVMVTLRSPSTLGLMDEVELRIFDGSGSTVWADTIAVGVEAGAASMLAPNAEFLVPNAQLALDRTWQVRRDPRGLLVDSDADTDRFPAGPQPINAVNPPPLRIRFVPISLSAHGGATGDVSLGNVEEYLRLVRQIAPVGPIEVSVGPAFSSSTSFGTPPSNGGDDSFWIPVLSQLDQARVASPTHADWYWIGVVRPPAGFNFTAFGGYGYIPGSGANAGPASRTSLVVQVGWFSRESQTRELVIHELGHNLGRFHAPCGNPAGPDPSFPVPGGLIGDGANDTWTFQQGQSLRALPVSPSTGDVMGYCSPTWYGTYNYGNIVAFRGSATVALMDTQTRRNALYVSGETDGTTVRLARPTAMTGIASVPDATGGWTVIGLDADGGELFRFPFALARWDHEVERRPIAVAVPVTASVQERLHEIRVVGPIGLGAALTLP